MDSAPFDERLEELSDAIRRGETLSLHDTLSVIDYQMMIRKYDSENTWWRRFLSYWPRIFKDYK